jgi:2-polyprenyl-6-methoxyphenol hydroxylase-like FAD-dependent oxidoreductase
MNITVVGGGMMGLCSAMLLAGDDHEVLLLERDPSPPPDPSLAWETWDRRGINQFRMSHLFLSRFRAVVEAELPQLAVALTAAGACRYNIASNIPEELKGGSRAGDEQFDMLSGRRAVVEAVAASMCEETPRVTVRRGAVVKGLLTGPPAGQGVPHVTGVELQDGQQVTSDLVVDATGRRSPLPGWLEAVGARPPNQVMDDSGFVYYARHFRSPDGSLPPMIGPLRQDYASLSCLTLPSDNGTWSVTITASSEDTALRAALDPQKWAAVVKLLPLAAHWLDGEPIDEKVAFMGKIEDRIRDFAPGGTPVATGVVAVADSWACTNPSLGRGASIGVVHAVALRDLLRRSGGSEPGQLATDWNETTRETVEPWFRSTLRYDRHRLAEIQSNINGQPYVSDDEEWNLVQGIGTNSLVDGDFLRGNLEIGMTIRLPDDVFSDRAMTDRLKDHMVATKGQPIPGPDRSQILAALSD